MSVSTEIRGITNFHTLHCDGVGCPRSFTLEENYGHLDEMRKRAEQRGWRFPADVREDQRHSDFCPRHAAELPNVRDEDRFVLSWPQRQRASFKRRRAERAPS